MTGRITPYTVRTNHVQLFRFSAVTWNAHRIHYDTAYARSEGYPEVLVQSHLHGCFLANAVLAWAGDGATLRTLRWTNRGIAVAGDVLTVTGTVTGSEPDGAFQLVTVDLEEHNQDGDLCTPGHAVVAVPSGSSVSRGARSDG
ncbi:acyl dehydratase [Prauserella marina]|uniref:MaoC like domain-containing protein n=1 Tax=Prauserella marina TaxID=530584 RepID=A0A222VTX5_9PSEU|nr:MaoC family dehydratase N-terminal domain-containing protein [Prauserella marina]ASR37395.1 acyl dehydratase [Prauserella marina]PWV74730.1 MaoC dehydratase-like protein [Prauserella marina]SDD42228.1 MaoC like domain-containing protein [Prauserella marina]